MDSTEYTYLPSDTQEWTRPAPALRPAAPKLSYLSAAREAAAFADVFDRPVDPAQEMEFARLYAALAQAEALTRIAEVLEQHLDDAAHDGLRRLIQTTFGD